MTSHSDIRESVRQIDEGTWLFGGTYVVRYNKKPSDGEQMSKDFIDYKIFEALEIVPDSVSIPSDSHVRLICDAGNASAVFSFGDKIILKVKKVHEDQPREDGTLEFLDRQKLSFEYPLFLCSMEVEDRIFMLEAHMSGERLNEAWWNMSEEKKEHVVNQVAEICMELKNFQSSSMTPIDFKWMDPLRESGQRDCRIESLQKHCEALGIDCSTFVFSHNDLGPTNILVDGDKVAILDWELAGYCPLAWVRTKFAVCGALNVSRVRDNVVDIDTEYRVRVEKKLAEMGFPEVTEAYEKMDKERSEKWIAARPWLQ
ncbi:hypothetical protein SS1G_08930 [Sclerotinia sclerotiorum 1980 UF-70]|uniref:Aminoglycoside phosphotransferase domain-containing protein n=2 Tax=Sclerotinia sclerotiorum (strain ATCC 18683 / 1980 / Ss-1) TaxID=665079 RepID=A7EUC3_SCLS1|nr:hypothetical protein SS1G_08930 [Sclerotinia sclerotiorum 1980 UF-70]APA15293.1 hypothetical protein sscle_14g100630 [Sclerotinia sclerotiorum 1980 UF-70]EDN93065.1 hypothetical protein SS1G_08930 [Sclerotinia sclerotiorum 1980 UF-70]